MDTAMGKVERIPKSPSPTMLALTDKYVDVISKRFRDMGMTLQIKRLDDHTVAFKVANEVRILHNNGVEATMDFAGFER